MPYEHIRKKYLSLEIDARPNSASTINLASIESIESLLYCLLNQIKSSKCPSGKHPCPSSCSMVVISM